MKNQKKLILAAALGIFMALIASITLKYYPAWDVEKPLGSERQRISFEAAARKLCTIQDACGAFPSLNDDAAISCAKCPKESVCETAKNGLTRVLTLDYWHNPVIKEFGSTNSLISLGSDGLRGGNDEAADIVFGVDCSKYIPEFK